ncbi:MAG TPA: hypothetical protein VIH89_17535 [Candidatus Sulfotelmatobacter sp.]
MSRMIDQIRASKLPSNMMQFAARGALSVPPAENIEILVYLARNNRVFGDLARMTLAGWDEKASLAAASDSQTSREVLDYFISPDNLRPKLLPSLLENPSLPESELAKFAISASRESIETMLRSARVRDAVDVLSALRSNPYLTKEKSEEIAKLLDGNRPESTVADIAAEQGSQQTAARHGAEGSLAEASGTDPASVHDETVSAYLAKHAGEIAAEADKPFQPVGGIVDLLGADYFPVSQVLDMPEPVTVAAPASGVPESTAPSIVAKKAAAHVVPAKRENTMQKINGLDVKGRIQLALKGNKEERSILIRDGTKVVALSVLEAPKLSDGEVEKFALQKNVLEAVLRQIPLKRRFMKNYIVVRNLVANPRTPLDLGLGLMKHLLTQDLKNISANKEVSETVRKLALKMYKQKLDAANKK